MQNLKSKISRYMTIITVGIISVIIVVSFLVSMLSAQSNARKEAKYLLKQIEQLFEENQQDLSEVKEELFNDFSLLRINEGVDYLAIDAKTETVIGATDSTLVGKAVSQTGLKMSKIIKDKNGFHARYGEGKSFIVFKRVGDTWIGRGVRNKVLYDNVPGNVFGLAVCCILMGIVQVFCITKYLNAQVVEGIHEVNKKLELISNGKLTENVSVKNSSEFVELSQYINDMVRNLMAGNRRLSYVLSKTHMQIGAYEYNDLIKRVVVTEQIAQILELKDEEMEVLVSDKNEFKKYINHVQRYIYDAENNIYHYRRYHEKYIRIEELYEHGKMFGVMIDMTDEILRRKQIEEERDVDLLTGLYNRRGLENRLYELFSMPERIGHGAIIMIDADGLKEINDRYGHDNGDIYLKKMGNIIKGFGVNESIASRQGGDEYVLVLYDYASEKELMNTIGTLEHIQNNSIVHLNEGQDVPLKFSFGYTIIGERTDYLAMMHEADEKMYESKRIRKGKKK
ncbi:MAG: diguanylate cyclase [Lachnospiraceae bacterium]|nr:diguanylate cyclase [Lachnospiraceae bacterium]